MTGVVALQHLAPGGHGDGGAAGGSRRRVADPVARRPADHRPRPARGRADPERERRRRRARHRGRGRRPGALRRLDERRGRDARPARHRTSPGPTGSTRPAISRAPATSSCSPGGRCRSPSCGELVREAAATIENGAVQRAHLERPARRLPGSDRRQDRAHRRRGLVRGRRRAAARLHDLRGRPRQPDPRLAQRRPARACSPGASPATGRSTLVRQGRATRARRSRYGRPAVPLVAASPARASSSTPTVRSCARSSPRRPSTLPVRRGRAARPRRGLAGRGAARHAPARRGPHRPEAGRRRADPLVRDPDRA